MYHSDARQRLRYIQVCTTALIFDAPIPASWRDFALDPLKCDIIRLALHDLTPSIVLAGLEFFSVFVHRMNLSVNEHRRGDLVAWRAILLPLLPHSDAEVRSRVMRMFAYFSNVSECVLAQALSTEVLELTSSKKRHLAYQKSYTQIQRVEDVTSSHFVDEYVDRKRSRHDDAYNETTATVQDDLLQEEEKDPWITSALTYILDDEYPSVRIDALRTLVILLSQQSNSSPLRIVVETFLLDMVHDESVNVRVTALRCLKKLQLPSTMEYAFSIFPCVREENATVRHVVLLTLANVKMANWSSSPENYGSMILLFLRHSATKPEDLAACLLATQRHVEVNAAVLEVWIDLQFGRGRVWTPEADNFSELSPVFVLLLTLLKRIQYMDAIHRYPQIREFIAYSQRTQKSGSIPETKICARNPKWFITCQEGELAPWFLPSEVLVTLILMTGQYLALDLWAVEYPQQLPSDSSASTLRFEPLRAQRFLSDFPRDQLQIRRTRPGQWLIQFPVVLFPCSVKVRTEGTRIHYSTEIQLYQRKDLSSPLERCPGCTAVAALVRHTV